MTKIDIVSGFLGAGKTTLIKKLLAEAFPGEKLVLIENEFGEISIDGGFLKESGVEISEMSAGCICCSLVGDFNQALKDVQAQFQPDRILIEPSGVGKLSDVIVAVENTAAETSSMQLNSFVTVADATKVKVYMKNFGEFYNNQIESAGTIILSRTQKLSQEKLEAAVALLREKNPDAAILTTPWDQLDGKVILSAIEKVSLADELLAKMRAEHEAEEAEHAHHHHDHDHEHHHHDHEDDEEHEHHHHGHEEEAHEHHHEHDEDAHHHDHEHEHEHHHEHEHDHECDDPNCSCHHHHHHADEVFTSWGKETPKVFSQAEISRILTVLDSGEYGKILRAKGIVNGEGSAWIEFDYVPEEQEVRAGHPDYTGRLCVIGAELKEEKLAELFGL
ncbi:CobW family GTP-binding protein [uncultured Dysosmobacter sp.]|uniref:CobW family GTP-binding protein n=1 Tax=uncultured Dysosmobacter sp. TaxID=2591384 RepID=UPI002602A2D8|nr:CobW family GTP-binding protein [uncultured Dysosmobacter sp.]